MWAKLLSSISNTRSRGDVQIKCMPECLFPTLCRILSPSWMSCESLFLKKNCGLLLKLTTHCDTNVASKIKRAGENLNLKIATTLILSRSQITAFSHPLCHAVCYTIVADCFLENESWKSSLFKIITSMIRKWCSSGWGDVRTIPEETAGIGLRSRTCARTAAEIEKSSPRDFKMAENETWYSGVGMTRLRPHENKSWYHGENSVTRSRLCKRQLISEIRDHRTVTTWE